MGTSHKRLIGVGMGLVFCLGCTTYGTNSIISHYYYFYGPEDTLEVLETSEISPENLALADLERAMVLLELGRYEDSLDALESADFRLESARAASSLGATRRGFEPWRPEYHERILASTLAMANSLALYDGPAAAAAADRALAEITEARCDHCDFNFTRVLATLAFAGAGRFADGISALDEVATIGRGEDLVDRLRERLERGVAGFQPEGLAPPPVESERFLVGVLFLGGGPYKEAEKLALTPEETVHWYRYMPREPQAVSWAAMDLEEPAVSVEFTDVDRMATAALDLRTQRVVAGEERPINPDKRDLRHWTSLPASLQLLVVDLPPEIDFADLVYYSTDGFEVDREPIELPGSWWGGPICLTRRMP